MRNGAGIITLEAWAAQSEEASEVADYSRAQRRLRLQIADAASRIVGQFTRRSFVPYQQTRVYDARGEHIDAYCLVLDEDLLEIVSLTNGDNASIASNQYQLRPNNAYPKSRIDLLSSGSVSWTYSTSWEGAISVNGIWGFNEAYQDAWIDTLDAIADSGGINATATTIVVSDADGADDRYRARFQTGGWLKADAEFMRVVDIDPENNTITVLRGQLGTTAASHDESTALYSYAPQMDIEQATIGLANWLERNRGTTGDSLTFVGATPMLMNQVPDYIVQTLKAYQKARIHVI